MKERICGDQTVVFVSHSDPQVQEICDRATWLEHGAAEKVLKGYRDSITPGAKKTKK